MQIISTVGKQLILFLETLDSMCLKSHRQIYPRASHIFPHKVNQYEILVGQYGNVTARSQKQLDSLLF